MDREVQYFYIAENGSGRLCGGVTQSNGCTISKFPLWREKGNYRWARRFTSVENAMQYAKDNDMLDTHVVDDTGNVMAVCNNRSLDTKITDMI